MNNDDESSVGTDGVEEMIFTITDPRYPFVGISSAESCKVSLERMLPRENGHYAEFFTIEGTDPSRVTELAEDADRVESTVLARRENSGLFEFVVSGGCPARHLGELGALPREVESTEGNGRIVAEVPPGHDAAMITAEFLDEHESAELIAKRQKEHSTPLMTVRELKKVIDDRLTDRQSEALRTAFEGGYYERPREKTGSMVAEDLQITSATFSQLIRAAERNLLSILYEESTT